jgi:hypothetical protein
MVRIIISICILLLSFQSHSQVAMWHAHNKTSSVTPPLDTYTGAAWAVSVRKIRTAYSGFCMKVRRESDNTTLDIGFDSNGLLDIAALETFCSGTDGRVHTWYDQSGNSINWVQTTNATQPYIVRSGATVKIQNKPSVRFLGYEVTPSKLGYVFSSTGSSTSTMFQVAHQQGVTPEGAVTNAGTVLSCNNSQYVMLANPGSGSSNYSGSGTPSFWINGLSKTITTRAQAATEYFTDASVPDHFNKILTMTNLNLSTYTSFETARFSGSNINGDHFISERIMYYTDRSSDRVGIETNLNSFYLIF